MGNSDSQIALQNFTTGKRRLDKDFVIKLVSAERNPLHPSFRGSVLNKDVYMLRVSIEGIPVE